MRGSLQDASAHLATMSAAVELYRQFGLMEVRRTQCLPLTEGLSYTELTF
jgi:hypothetical protein